MTLSNPRDSLRVSFMERIPYYGNEANSSSMLGLPRLPDTCMTPNEQHGDTLGFYSVVFFLCLRWEFMTHWVDFFPPVKLRNGDVDQKVNSE